MNADTFSDLLRHPAKLYQINYHELKSLVLQYPYCTNLHMLLLEKSIVDQLPDEERNLQRAATLCPDRAQLRRQVTQWRLLAEANNEGTALEFSRVPDGTDVQLQPQHQVRAGSTEDKTELAQDDKTGSQAEYVTDLRSTMGDIAQVVLIANEITGNSTSRRRKPKPKKKKRSFTRWVERLQPGHVQEQLDHIMESRKREEAKQKRKEARKDEKLDKEVGMLAEESLQPPEDLISESLARLLAEQGEREKAIEMYEKLRLRIPEKSSFFADRIRELKQT